MPAKAGTHAAIVVGLETCMGPRLRACEEIPKKFHLSRGECDSLVRDRFVGLGHD
jgi:hypothetical protein